MDVNELRKELKNNGIEELEIQINPPYCPPGLLCLKHEGNQKWTVTLNKQGYTLNESFDSEHEACRYYLEKSLREPTNRIGFKQEDLFDYPNNINKALIKYGFEPIVMKKPQDRSKKE